MSDGAHQGITPTGALDTILGGEPAPATDEGMSRQEMREQIQAVDLSRDAQTYDEAAMQAARLVYDFITEDPMVRRLIPAETVYDLEHPAYVQWMKTGSPDPHDTAGMVKALSLYDVMKDEGIDLASLGLSGFQWGWAVNAARYALAELPVANPAILETR